MAVLRVQPVVDPKVRALCRKAYPGHPKGCPNWGCKAGCPPKAPLYHEAYDCTKPVYAITRRFDLQAHAARMLAANPGWSDRQCRCCLYWQKGVRKRLDARVQAFLASRPGYRSTQCPEGMGVNVTQTLADAGMVLEWPPKHYVRLVAFVALPRR